MEHYIYIIGPELGGDLKIGHSKNPSKRLKQIQTSHPEKLYVLYEQKVDNREIGEQIEKRIHNNLRNYKKSGEWFEIPLDKAKYHVCEIISPNNNPYKKENFNKIEKQKTLLCNELTEIEEKLAFHKGEINNLMESYMIKLQEYSVYSNSIPTTLSPSYPLSVQHNPLP